VAYNFALMGVSGYIAPRHLKAIVETDNRIVAAVDPHDSAGILDRFSLNARFFRETERFDRHLFKLHRGPEESRVQYVSICTPNYLHDAHIRLALRNGANAICEKPLVISPWNLDGLKELEEETGRKVFTVLQLRLHPSLLSLKKSLEGQKNRSNVELTYVTSRGPWYDVSWKGTEEQSGGTVTNIGIHLFDMLLWLFGDVKESFVYENNKGTLSGMLMLEKADVKWFLSLDADYLPKECGGKGKNTFRSIRIDGREIEFSEGFTDLHTVLYRETLAGRGYGIDDAKPSIELAYKIRKSEISKIDNEKAHPLLAKGSF
jgi:UDP-N-acetyl-2-amino-2-deoxyglucuronate dehydrogenase